MSSGHNADGTTSTLAVGGLFVFIGATPSTEWLQGQLAVDEDRFVLTGASTQAPNASSGLRLKPISRSYWALTGF